MLLRVAFLIAALGLMVGAAAPAIGAGVTVFAAASLKEALDEQVKQFESVTGSRVIVAYGGSNALARQIEAGAPAEVFISADVDWMDYLDRLRLLVPGSRTNLLSNELVLIARRSNRTMLHIAPDFGLATALGNEKLAMANPDGVPAGRYGRSALEALGVWVSVQRQVVRTENVRAALALVARGEATLGIVYKTDALAEKAVRIVDTFPEATHAPIVYPGALVAPARSPVATSLLEFLRSSAARPTWAKYGFVPL